MVLFDQDSRSGAANNDIIQFNTDTGSNYARRLSVNDGTDSTSINRPGIELYGHSTNNAFYTGYIANLAGKEKLAQIQLNSGGSTGAGNVSRRVEIAGKWTDTSNAINEIKWKPNNSTETFGSGSEMVVLGWDPADTHTSNFWEELASVELGSAGDTLDTGTFTAKKYLWVQVYTKNSGTINHAIRYNSDTGSNYSFRRNQDGGSDITDVNQSNDPTISMSSLGGFPLFANLFIINNSAQEKLSIAHTIMQNTAGAGNAPIRREGVAKWANTSSQITQITVTNGDPGSYDTGSIIKVWGHD
jgi:hypothetical protein